jgi:hypothetical protein
MTKSKRSLKVTLLVMLTGGAVFSSCSAVQWKNSFLSGTQAFVAGYTTQAWNELVPAPATWLNFEEAAE